MFGRKYSTASSAWASGALLVNPRSLVVSQRLVGHHTGLIEVGVRGNAGHHREEQGSESCRADDFNHPQILHSEADS